MNDWIATALVGTGTLFSLLAAVGILRMPDLYMRTQAAAKSSTLGVSCIVLAMIVHFGTPGITTRAVLVIAFLFLTVPVSAHMIGRAAYSSGVALWEHSVVDELKEREHEPAQTRRDSAAQ